MRCEATRPRRMGMGDASDIVRRKDEHLDLALAQQGRAGGGFDHVRFAHCALPELDLEAVSIATSFLSRELPAPFMVSSMTGGPARGGEVNRNLAEACEALGLPVAVGSQRVALEDAGSAGFRDLRRVAPTTLLFGNIGGAQLAKGWGVDEARRAVEMLQADGLFVHLNPLQEAVQAGGDVDWRGVLGGIERLAKGLDKPLLVKEVGFGLSADVARRLVDAGAAGLDVAGAGGTDWAAIETRRSREASAREVGAAFAGWGLRTAEALVEVRQACPDTLLIGSGGVRDGVDSAKAIRLGADLVGQAGPVLRAALTSTEAVLGHFAALMRQLRIACFCTGSADLAALKTARLL